MRPDDPCSASFSDMPLEPVTSPLSLRSTGLCGVCLKTTSTPTALHMTKHAGLWSMRWREISNFGTAFAVSSWTLGHPGQAARAARSLL